MILYEDKDIIVCHKMAGVAVQSARIGEKDLVSMLNNHLMEQAEKRKPEPVRVVHRLDQPVEGIVVFAKNKKAAASLSAQITDGSMKKVYQAVCCVTEEGRHWILEMENQQQRQLVASEAEAPEKEPNGKNGQNGEKRSPITEMHTLVDYLAKDARTNSSAVVKKGQKNAKEARLSFGIVACEKVTGGRNASTDAVALAGVDVASGEDTGSVNLVKAAGSDCLLYALAEIHLDTGRHHQIRVQMAHAGLPLFGDRKYNPKWERYAKAWQEQMIKESADPVAVHHLPVAELALCATELTFRHPTSGKQMHFQVEPQKKIFQMF